MPTVREIATEIVRREGGFMGAPDDPDGTTDWAATIQAMRRLGLDLTGDGQITPADLRELTREQAVDLFISQYFEAPGIAGLPDVLHDSVFDMYVNAGAGAVMILQQLLGEMGLAVDVDGVIGPQTRDAARAAFEAAPGHLADAYAIARRNYYFRLADKRPSRRKFVRSRAGGKGGWIRRAEDFMSARYRMSDAQFGERVAAWD